MNALAKPEVGKYVNDHFVASFQKISSFKLVGENKKQGGNVASYFCTPDGRVLHAIAGPVDAKTMLKEARWVVETWKLADLKGVRDNPLGFKNLWSQAHLDRLRQEYKLDPGKMNNLPFPVNPAVLTSLGKTGGGRNKNQGKQLDKQGKVHVLLASNAVPKIEQVYNVVFEKILNQKINSIPVVQKG